MAEAQGPDAPDVRFRCLLRHLIITDLVGEGDFEDFGVEPPGFEEKRVLGCLGCELTLSIMRIGTTPEFVDLLSVPDPCRLCIDEDLKSEPNGS